MDDQTELIEERPEIAALIRSILDETRKRHGLVTDYALAKYLNTPQSNIKRWEQGKVGISTVILLQLQQDMLTTETPR